MTKDDKTVTQIKELIDKLYNKKTDKGITYSTTTIVEINTLKSLLKFDVSDSQIIKAITYNSNIPNIRVDEFKQFIRTIQRKEKEDDKRTEWRIFIPIDIRIPRLKFTIHDLEFSIINKKEFSKLKTIEFYRNTIFNDYFLEPYPSTWIGKNCY